jgi:hypothetical protein
MKKETLLRLLIALLVFCLAAARSAPAQVRIISVMDLSSGTGTFKAFGPAAAAGVICPQGAVTDLNYRVAKETDRYLILHVQKRFECTHGSGAFQMYLRVRLAHDSGDTTAKWRVVGGMGQYADLAGEGRLAGVNLSEGVIRDTYQGRLYLR